MDLTPRKAVEAWGRLLSIVGLLLIVVAAAAPFVIEGVEFTLEDFVAFFAYGIISIGSWGVVLFVLVAVPLALVVWLIAFFAVMVKSLARARNSMCPTIERDAAKETVKVFTSKNTCFFATIISIT